MLIYFMVYLLIGSMFLLNFFTGVIQLNYLLAEAASKNKYLSDTQSKWIEVQRLIM